MPPTILVPDSVNGAIMLSVIDFFLSFIVIGGIGVVLAAFPLLNGITLRGEKDLIED